MPGSIRSGDADVSCIVPLAHRTSSASSRLLLTAALLIAATTIGVYADVVHFEFLTWDDPLYVTKNAQVQAGLGLEGVRWAFTTGHAGNWHPVTWLSHMLDVTLFGVTPAGPHAVNVALHVLNALLLLWVLHRMTGDPGPSALTAALFALHPLHVESVAWIAERKDVLSTFFALLAVAAYVSYARRGGVLRYAAVALALALGLMSKAMVVTLPCVLLLLDYWPLRRMRLPFGLDSDPELPAGIRVPRTASIAMLFAEKLPLLALSAGLSIATHAMQTIALRYGDPIGLGDRVTNAIVAYGWYVMKTLWPSGLGLLYSHPNMAGGTPWTAVQVTAAAALLLAAAACVVFARRRRALTVGILWFVGTLVPVIGLVQVGMQAFADRYTYLPLIGLFIAVSWEGKALVDRLAVWRRGARTVAVVVCAAVLAGFAITARTQVATWRDSRTLFTHSLAVWPGNATMHYSLGRVLWAAGDTAGAIANYRETIRIMPTYGGALLSLGSSLYLMGRSAEALEPLEAAVVVLPSKANSHFYLAATNAALGNYDKAIESYRVAISIDPGRAVFRQGIGQALMGAGRYAEARAEFAEAQRLGAQRPAAEP